MPTCSSTRLTSTSQSNGSRPTSCSKGFRKLPSKPLLCGDAGWAEEILRRQGKVYKALGAEDRILVDRFEGGHAWNGKVALKVRQLK